MSWVFLSAAREVNSHSDYVRTVAALFPVGERVEISSSLMGLVHYKKVQVDWLLVWFYHTNSNVCLTNIARSFSSFCTDVLDVELGRSFDN